MTDRAPQPLPMSPAVTLIAKPSIAALNKN